MGTNSTLAGLGGRIGSMGFKHAKATAVRIGEPGTGALGLNNILAGLGARSPAMGIIERLALACGRISSMGFTGKLATALGKGEPGTCCLGINGLLAGLDERIRVLGIKTMLALACDRRAALGLTNILATAVRFMAVFPSARI